jgi:uncharacterized membrane protein (UPF0127 family)
VLAVALLTGGCVVPFDAGSDAATSSESTASPSHTASPTPTASPPPSAHQGYEQTTVTVHDGETGERLGSVRAAIADNGSLRFTGLSETDDLPDDRGMLFVYDAPVDPTYVMRNMSFGIDIVFIGSNGTITGVHHAPAPGPDEDGNEQRYPGTGQYVLEVNYEWTAERGVEVGDRVAFDLPG